MYECCCWFFCCNLISLRKKRKLFVHSVFHSLSRVARFTIHLFLFTASFFTFLFVLAISWIRIHQTINLNFVRVRRKREWDRKKRETREFKKKVRELNVIEKNPININNQNWFMFLLFFVLSLQSYAYTC